MHALVLFSISQHTKFEVSSFNYSKDKSGAPELNKKLRYRRGTARRATSDEILSTAAKLYEKSRLQSLQ